MLFEEGVDYASRFEENCIRIDRIDGLEFDHFELVVLEGFNLAGILIFSLNSSLSLPFSVGDLLLKLVVDRFRYNGGTHVDLDEAIGSSVR